MIEVETASELKDLIGQNLSLKAPMIVTAEKLNAFLDVSDDRQSIHDPMNKGATVLPANLLLSMIPSCMKRLINVKSKSQVMTTGYHNVLFRQPLHLFEPFGVGCSVVKVISRNHQNFVYYDVIINSEKTHKTAVSLRVADCYFDDV